MTQIDRQDLDDLLALLKALREIKATAKKHPEGTYLSGEAKVLYAMLDAIEGDYSSVNRVN